VRYCLDTHAVIWSVTRDVRLRTQARNAIDGVVKGNLLIADPAGRLELPHGDPFNRVITATAKVHGFPLLTRDRAITDSGVMEIIW
jgi:PIN domain nuclease of toxin-antitoxin system